MHEQEQELARALGRRPRQQLLCSSAERRVLQLSKMTIGSWSQHRWRIHAGPPARSAVRLPSAQPSIACSSSGLLGFFARQRELEGGSRCPRGAQLVDAHGLRSRHIDHCPAFGPAGPAIAPGRAGSPPDRGRRPAFVAVIPSNKEPYQNRTETVLTQSTYTDPKLITTQSKLLGGT